MNKQRFTILVLLISLTAVSDFGIVRVNAISPLSPLVDRITAVSVPAGYSDKALSQLVGFSATNYSVGEAEATATIAVTLDAASSTTVTVDYATSDNIAVGGSDYLAANGVLTFTPGVTSQTFGVSILDDVLQESNETITLTLGNPTGGTLHPPESATLTILDDDKYIHLPFVSRRWPPMPYTPVLNSISNPDYDDSYTVDWNSAELAESYTLEEATNANFTDAMVVYQDTGTSYIASDQPEGIYYYRVKASNSWGDSGWSSVQLVNLGPPDTPVLDPISNPDGDGNYTVSWNQANLAQTYTLQEDGIAVYSGVDTSKAISGQDEGLYYYRVQASNAFGSSGWSNVESVLVPPQPDCPRTGSWSGTTSQEYDISFTVANTPACQAESLKIKFRCTCTGGTTTIEITFGSPKSISNNHFEASTSKVDVIGDFTSSTIASGSWSSSFYSPYVGQCFGSGDWTASVSSLSR